MKFKKASEVLIEQLVKTGANSQKSLEQVKRRVAKKFKIPLPKKIDLLKTYHRLLKEKRVKKSSLLENLLKTRPVRSLSGIVNVSVLTKHYPCPGQCIFCPTLKSLPKSYLPGEPAVERARLLKFDPYLQTGKRIEMLESQGHPTDKIELRVIGGTWSFYPKRYQTWFMKKCFSACNQFLNKKQKNRNLTKEQKINEGARHRMVGLSIETRPDFITVSEIKRLRRLGVTLVEMGVQSLSDKVLKNCQTGLTIEKIIRATRLLKDAGFKVLYQIMPNLPGANLRKDLKVFKNMFEKQEFRPDWLKIYPCLVCKNTRLYHWWKKGKYQPYTDKELVELLVKIKKFFPYWVRVARVFRDIPAQAIIAGSKSSNFRQMVGRELKRKNFVCSCLRCREVRERYDPKEKIHLFRQNYRASQGKEIFLSLENKKRTKLYSFLRLRLPSPIFQGKNHFLSELQDSALIRELHTYGPARALGKKYLRPSQVFLSQHRGFGKKLIKSAEKITREEFGLKKIAVISGVGARNYYRQLGYRLKNTYMMKSLK